MIKVIDAHTHLEEVKNLTEAVKRAENSGVLSIITVGSDLESSRRALDISGRYGQTMIYPALGIHPWNLRTCDPKPAFEFIEENIEKAVAVGEIGLDYWLKEAKKDMEQRTRQKEVFKSLLRLGRKYEKPAIIHTRGAWEDCFDLAVETETKKAVFHWYSGPLEILDKILGQGYYISANPAAEHSKKHQAAIADTPLERILLETDSPVKYQYKESEPADVLRTLEAVVRLKSVSMEDAANITTRNAKEFFNL
ncbi:MAG: TatD family hydrolase [Desulfobacteraceae bacterium]|nr:TatD family hydrolase [Desulfobacteraceae bacterium]